VIQLLVHSVEHDFRVIEALQQGSDAALFLCGQKVMPARDRARALTKPLDAQHLAANWTDELFRCPIAGAA